MDITDEESTDLSNTTWTYAGGEAHNSALSVSALGSAVYVAMYNPDHVIVPKEFALRQNYPNPFNPTTTIEYDVAADAHIVIKIYNILGQEVATLVSDRRSVGRYRTVWNGKNDRGESVSSSVYFYRLQAGSVVKTRKMLLVK